MRNLNIKKHLPKVLSGVLSLTILCSMIGVASYSAGAEVSGKTTKTEAAASKDKDSSSKAKLNKNETVYVLAEANGSAKKVIVSDWIQNSAKADKFTDVSNLNDVENVNGDETFTINEKNMYEWNADGNDIYYQGTSSSELPVGVNVTYKLDGKTVKPDDLAGKSGKVTMRFDYSNRQYEEVKIDGKKEKIYVPFVMITGMMLDNDSFKNVEVSNGKILNDGSHTYVAGFALPGMQDSLNLDKDSFEIPDYVEITADVEDFQLSTTLTLATNDMFSNVDFSKLDDKMDELDSKLSELTDATNQLIDGSSELYKGLNTLLDKSQELVAGVDKLYSGASQIKDGAASLDSGASELSGGAASLDNGVGTFQGGVNQLDNGASSLDSGAGQLSNGAYSLDAGVSQLQGYIAELSGGLSTISGNSTALKAGAKQVFETLLATADKQIAAAGLTADKLTIDNYQTVLGALIGSLSEDNVRQVAYDKALAQVTETVKSQSSTIRSGVENEYRKQVTEGVLAAAGMSMTYDQYEAAVAAGSISEDVQAQISQSVSSQMSSSSTQAAIDSLTQTQIQSLIDKNMQGEEVQSGIEEAVQKASAGKAALEALKTQLDSYNEFYQGILSYTAGVDQANAGAQQILGGTYSLKDGSSSLASGASDLKNGTSSLKSGTSDLKSGASDLKNGSSTLKNGTDTLKNGTSTLASGAVSLFDGIASLKDGGSQLLSGVKQLADGSMTLNKGLKQYKEEGVDVIVDAVNGDVKGLVNRLKAISNVSTNYKSYSGISDDMDGKVDFIFKTDSVETDD